MKKKKGANNAILLDCCGVLFLKNPNPKEVYKNIMNLYEGKKHSRNVYIF